MVQMLNQRREAAGSSPATPTCGYGVVVTQNPSKVLSWVRIPLPAHRRFRPLAAGPIAQRQSARLITAWF